MGGKGQQPFLTSEQEEQLAQEIATGRFRTAAQIRGWIIEQYGVSYKHLQPYEPSQMRTEGAASHPCLCRAASVLEKREAKKGAD